MNIVSAQCKHWSLYESQMFFYLCLITISSLLLLCS
ncbi:MAG: sortase B protein-sorting domain-containing protein [Thomasclavelia sp.]